MKKNENKSKPDSKAKADADYHKGTRIEDFVLSFQNNLKYRLYRKENSATATPITNSAT